jgi:hypothetical protein
MTQLDNEPVATNIDPMMITLRSVLQAVEEALHIRYPEVRSALLAKDTMRKNKRLVEF